MCCFAGHVSDVRATNIFARVEGGRQCVVYEMTFSSEQPTAMILPVPIAAGADEDSVEFVALDGYPNFFHDLETHFLKAYRWTLGLGAPGRPLQVSSVGAFEASFAPNVDSLDRLDPRFTIPRHIWKQQPVYSDYGFVVFKLQHGRNLSVHPMAFWFPTRHPATLFLPALHIHDGTIRAEADFDHVFYTQNEPTNLRCPWPGAWMTTETAPKKYVSVKRTKGLVDPDAPCFQSSLVRSWRNVDISIPIETNSSQFCGRA